MSGLFTKEFIVIMKNNKLSFIVIPMFLIFGIMNHQLMFLMLIPALLSMLPLGTMTYDEVSHWDMYVYSLPVKKKSVVTSKYATVLVLALISTVLIGTILFLLKNNVKDVDNNTIAFMTAASLIIGMIVPSISIPINLKFGTSKGRIIYLIIVGAICGIIPTVIISDAQNLTIKLMKIVSNPAILALVTIGIVAAISFISWLISVRIYEKKER